MSRLFLMKPSAAMLIVLTVGCFAILGSGVLAQEYQLEVGTTRVFGTFNGIDYIKVRGRFIGSANERSIAARFEIVAPADPQQGNGRLLVEPFHFAVGAGARDWLLGHDLLFGQGFSYAGIQNHGITVFAAFAEALKAGDVADILGNIEHLYSIGFSDSAEPVHLLLLDPLGQNLFDLSFVLTTGWPVPKPPFGFASSPEDVEPHVLPDTAGRIMYFQTEADVALWGTILRDGLTPSHRYYEVAGGSHIPAPTRTTGVDWIPVLRALFVAGDRWVTEGIEPPPNTILDEAMAGEIDPVYDRVTGIARDANLNATGGIRLPDVALGRGRFIAVDVDRDVLNGTFVDLACEPLPEGSVRFADHDSYVSRFAQAAEQLVEDGFLLPEAANQMIEEATASDVGKPDSCP